MDLADNDENTGESRGCVNHAGTEGENYSVIITSICLGVNY